MENVRVKGVTTEKIRKWWPALRIPAVAVIKPENRYNVDEGGLMEGKTGNGLVLGLRGTRPLQKKKARFIYLDVLYRMHFRYGVRFPPLIIFKGKYVQN
jgi:hypothetical protein